jgi:hypothetical protein
MSWIKSEYQRLDRSSRALRRFGFTVGLVILCLGVVLWWQQHRAGFFLMLSGGVLLLAAGLAPSSLKWVYAPWMIGSLALGRVVTAILLTTVFFLVLTPIGWLQRLFGKSAIEVAFKQDSASYWQTRTAPPAPEDYEKQF